MFTLLALSGASIGGCVRSAVPPDLSIQRNPIETSPGISRATPRNLDPQPYSLPTLSINPWKPSVSPRKWDSIVIHHTAALRGSVESIHEAHLKRKDKAGNPWLGIAYHFVIGNGNGMVDGSIEPTFRWREQLHGAHAGADEYNQHGIGIALVGNFEDGPPSSAQLASVKRLVAALKMEYEIKGDRVVGHSTIKATACPGKYFPMDEVSRSLPDVYLGQFRRNAAPPTHVAAAQRN